MKVPCPGWYSGTPKAPSSSKCIRERWTLWATHGERWWTMLVERCARKQNLILSLKRYYPFRFSVTTTHNCVYLVPWIWRKINTLIPMPFLLAPTICISRTVLCIHTHASTFHMPSSDRFIPFEWATYGVTSFFILAAKMCVCVSLSLLLLKYIINVACNGYLTNSWINRSQFIHFGEPIACRMGQKKRRNEKWILRRRSIVYDEHVCAVCCGSERAADGRSEWWGTGNATVSYFICVALSHLFISDI